MEQEYQQEAKGKGVGAETVQAKGLRLYRSGSVKHLQGAKYLVEGDHGTYEVHYEDSTCKCPSRVYCSHVCAVEVAVAKENARAIRALEAKREEVRRRGAYRPDTAQNDAITAALDRMAL